MNEKTSLPSWMIEKIKQEEGERQRDANQPRLYIDDEIPPDRPRIDDDEFRDSSEQIEMKEDE